jgi:hypothetical protein
MKCKQMIITIIQCQGSVMSDGGSAVYARGVLLEYFVKYNSFDVRAVRTF